MLLVQVGIRVAALVQALKEKAEKPSAVLAAVTALHEKVDGQDQVIEDLEAKATATRSFADQAKDEVRTLSSALRRSQPAAIEAIREAQDKVPAIYLP